MIPVIAIFDIGKTNKKVFLFDEDYQIRYEHAVELPETKDEDGFPCEDIHALSQWVTNTFQELRQEKEFDIRALNVSAHGASFVHLDSSGKIVTPLYNYLKPYPDDLRKKFYHTYGGEADFARITASPVLGNLNSGMQLYWLKHTRPEIFSRIRYSLHLPEYISYLFTGKPVSGITSIGCHTNLWDFTNNRYHPWVHAEGISEKLAPLAFSSEAFRVNWNGHSFLSGIGLHDSSAALIPYLRSINRPFVLVSTGTWSISLNPFNHTPLTKRELEMDCLCYMTYDGKPVKASRLFIGQIHDKAVKKLAQQFQVSEDYYKKVTFHQQFTEVSINTPSAQAQTFEEGYHQIMLSLLNEQKTSSDLVVQHNTTDIYVDGGFSKNILYMHLLKNLYPTRQVCAAELSQASALGAALVIHDSWNTRNKPASMVKLNC